MSRAVSLYSGAKVAQTSTPQADQHISHSHTIESWSPPHAGVGRLDRVVEVRAVEAAVEERQDHHHEERHHQQRSGEVAERDTDAHTAHVEDPDGEDQPDRDELRQPDLDRARREVARDVRVVRRPAEGLAREPGALDDLADEDAVDGKHDRPPDPVAERRDRTDERRVLPPGLVRVERESAGLLREHRGELGVERVDEDGDERRDPPQQRGAPAAEVADRVAQRPEQESRVRERDDEAVVPAKRLEKLPFLDYCCRHLPPPARVG